MQRMTGIDPMFIYSDTPETPMEIAYACVFDPAATEGGYEFERSPTSCGADPDARALPAPAHAGATGSGPPALGRRPRLRPGRSPAPGGPADPGRRGRVQRHGGRGDGPAPHPRQPPWEMHLVEGMARARSG